MSAPSPDQELHSWLHAYCLFYKDDQLQAGWIKNSQKGKFLVIPLQGKEQWIPPNRLPYRWKAKSLMQDEKSSLSQLQKLMEEMNQSPPKLDLQVVHELCDPSVNYSFEELCELFLDDRDSAAAKLGFFLQLDQEHKYFRVKNERYWPRSSEEIQHLEENNLRELAQKQWEEQIQQWLQKLEEKPLSPEELQEKEVQSLLQQIFSILIHGKNSPTWKKLSPLLKISHPLRDEEDLRLRRLLFHGNKPISFGKICLLRGQVPLNFSEELILHARQFVQQHPGREFQKNTYKGLTYTIDSHKTKDFDDALTIHEWQEDYCLLTVHIADLSHYLGTEQVLFQEAERRMSSVYTLKQVYPMFPELLSQHRFSLVAHQPREVVSFQFKLFTDGQTQLISIQQEVVQIQENLTYDQVDYMIQDQQDGWARLSAICEELRKKRIEAGAIELSRQEIDIDISQPENIRIYPVDRNSPSNILIQELAILVNHHAARYFRDHDLPGIFRTQAPYEILREPNPGETLGMEHLLIESAKLTCIPDRHSGLGCDVYMQVTSPIRRFIDLLCQQQLLKHLQKTAVLYSLEQLQSWAIQAETLQKQYNSIERELVNYWKRKYLAQHVGENFEAVLKRNFNQGKSELLLEKIQYVLPVMGIAHHPEGTRLIVQIRHVDVLHHQVQVSIVKN